MVAYNNELVNCCVSALCQFVVHLAPGSNQRPIAGYRLSVTLRITALQEVLIDPVNTLQRKKWRHSIGAYTGGR